MAEAERAEPALWDLVLTDETATGALARFVAEEIREGDLVTLSGGLGTGKTSLARAVIRALADDPALDVPSPTFTLIQTYDTRRGTVVHADLYRINGAEELVELGWDEARHHIVLVEWPERAGIELGADRLDIQLSLSPKSPGIRLAALKGHGSFGPRLRQARGMRNLLERTGWREAQRTFMQGDASTRAYERLVKSSGDSAILMISPPRPDGPPIRRGKSYSTIAHLAESIHAFVAMDRGLRSLGFSAPEIYGAELDDGLLLIEDLGQESVIDENGPIPERYGEAARLLAKLHVTILPQVLPMQDEQDHILQPYGLDALLIEAELVLEWYVSYIARIEIPSSAKLEFLAIWTETLNEILTQPPTWTLRDYHSPNLLWLPGREGIARIGVIDFQDAVLGHPAYDVVSLLQDARVDVPPDLELKLIGLYGAARKRFEPDFDLAAFARAYAILGAQRATKLLGIFARLDKRDGKPAYLKHLPRIKTYLARNLAHPALGKLKVWYETHLRLNA